MRSGSGSASNLKGDWQSFSGWQTDRQNIQLFQTTMSTSLNSEFKSRIINLIVHPDGSLYCLYDEAINLAAIGHLAICRASHVEPDAAGNWWADLACVHGPRLGPFALRSAALEAERRWVEQHVLA